MEVLHPVVAGMDVHRDTVVVTILKVLPNGRTWKETKSFQTFTDQLRAMVVRLSMARGSRRIAQGIQARRGALQVGEEQTKPTPILPPCFASLDGSWPFIEAAPTRQ